MNIIVTNKYKDLIYSTNIEILKELNGVFKVSQIVNSFNSIFFKKIIIDATALDGFPKDTVLKELVASFETDKLILILPPDNPPPKKFLNFLVSINLYNFTDNPEGLMGLVNKSNTKDDVKEYLEINDASSPEDNILNNNSLNNINELGEGRKIVLGFNSVNENSFITEIIYSIKKTLEEKYQKNVIAIEIDKRNFVFYNSPNMFSLSNDKVNLFMQNNTMNADIVLIDISMYNNTSICNDILYLINPSLFEINKMMFKNKMIFNTLKGKKVIFTNSLLTSNDVNQFAREAGISVYYNLAPINDRISNENINKLLSKMGIVENISSEGNKSGKKGLFNIFK